jgi:hypothetical protein
MLFDYELLRLFALIGAVRAIFLRVTGRYRIFNFPD